MTRVGMVTSNEICLEGGCLCGAIRYRATGMPFMAEYCHCRMCQKAAGAAFGNWMDFDRDQVEWLKGRPKEYLSSAGIRRGFCEHCGSSLTFRSTEHPRYLTLTINSLDDPDLVPPSQHIYTSGQVAWLKLGDTCARYEAQATREV